MGFHWKLPGPTRNHGHFHDIIAARLSLRTLSQVAEFLRNQGALPEAWVLPWVVVATASQSSQGKSWENHGKSHRNQWDININININIHININTNIMEYINDIKFNLFGLMILMMIYRNELEIIGD